MIVFYHNAKLQKSLVPKCAVADYYFISVLQNFCFAFSLTQINEKRRLKGRLFSLICRLSLDSFEQEGGIGKTCGIIDPAQGRHATNEIVIILAIVGPAYFGQGRQAW